MTDCTECKSAIWDYEEYYGTTQKEYFVCGCKENKDPEMCNEDYKGGANDGDIEIPTYK